MLDLSYILNECVNYWNLNGGGKGTKIPVVCVVDKLPQAIHQDAQTLRSAPPDFPEGAQFVFGADVQILRLVALK